MEASGTSGMKVLPNGGLNLSILDGWWSEAYEREVGWAIGKGEDYADHAYQDYVESSALYDLLEKEIVPLFYHSEAEGLPRAWIARMKKSLKLLSPIFSTNRMLWEYCENYYLPSARYYASMCENHMERARRLVAWKSSITGSWAAVEIVSIEAHDTRTHHVGEGFELSAVIRLGEIKPEDVAVEVYYGPLDAQRQIVEPQNSPMSLEGEKEPGIYRYRGRVPCDRSGMQGYAVRVVPSHPDANSVLYTGLMTWS
jgi:starch phosphorylase